MCMCTLKSKDLAVLEVQKNAGRMLPTVVNNNTIHNSVKSEVEGPRVYD